MADIVWKITSLPDAIVGVPYKAGLGWASQATALTALSAAGLPSSGNLVCTLAGGAVITGTPSHADVGTYSVTVTATDTAGASASAALPLVVRYADEGDTTSLTATGQLNTAHEARKWPASH